MANGQEIEAIGWQTSTLKDVCELITDGTHHSPPNSHEGEFLYVTAKNIKKHGLDTSIGMTYVTKEVHDAIYNRCPVEFEDVLFIKDGATTGIAVVNHLNEPFSMLSSVALLKPVRSAISPHYLKHWLNSPETFKKFTNKMTGTAIRRVVLKQIREADVEVPPLAEQQQITARLDALLAQVDTLKTRLDSIPAILKRFRQSVLAAAVSGRLTEAWRVENRVPLDSWLSLKLGNVVESIEAGKNLKCIETPPSGDEHGIIKISAVTWGTYNEAESKTLPDNNLFIESRRIYVGDFLISRANTIELLGNPVIVHEVTKNLMLSDKVLRLVMPEADKPWVSMFLRSSDGRKEIESRSTGNQMSMRNIGQKALLDIDLPKPSSSEQTEIVRRVEQLFAFTDQIEQRVKDAQSRVNHLTQSILAKAFRGELTAEWREQNPDLISGDNSAEALLERIKAELDTLRTTPKKRKKKTIKKDTNQESLNFDLSNLEGLLASHNTGLTTQEIYNLSHEKLTVMELFVELQKMVANGKVCEDKTSSPVRYRLNT